MNAEHTPQSTVAESGGFGGLFGLLGDGGTGAPPSGWLLGAVIWAFLTLIWLVFFASSALTSLTVGYPIGRLA